MKRLSNNLKSLKWFLIAFMTFLIYLLIKPIINQDNNTMTTELMIILLIFIFTISLFLFFLYKLKRLDFNNDFLFIKGNTTKTIPFANIYEIKMISLKVGNTNHFYKIGYRTTEKKYNNVRLLPTKHFEDFVKIAIKNNKDIIVKNSISTLG